MTVEIVLTFSTALSNIIGGQAQLVSALTLR